MVVNVPANSLAYLVLFSWPLIAIGLFLMFPPRWACAVTFIAGEMFLPCGFEVHFSGIPPFDKEVSICVAAVLGCLIAKPRTLLRGSKTGSRYILFLLLIAVGEFFTVQTNPDPIKVGHEFLPGLTLHDFVLMSVRTLLSWWPAFFLGRKLFTKPEHLEVLSIVLTVGGLIYSLFILVELKMSPIFNSLVYGYSASIFSQSVRYGGYRPVVFMRHGLNVALFMLMTLLAATALARARVRLFGVPTQWFAVYLAVILVATHSSGVVVDAAVLIPALLWMRSRSQARLATTIAALVLFYPLLRFLDLIPVDSVVGFFNFLLGPERAESLSFRFTNETELLNRATLRPWFGWGGYARQMTFNEWGGQKTIIDGEWIGILGYSGVVGFIGRFGLYLLPIFVFAKKRLPQLPSRRDTIMGSTALFMAAAYVFDLLPNAGVAPYLTMIVGALAGVQIDRHPQFELQAS